MNDMNMISKNSNDIMYQINHKNITNTIDKINMTKLLAFNDNNKELFKIYSIVDQELWVGLSRLVYNNIQEPLKELHEQDR